MEASEETDYCNRLIEIMGKVYVEDEKVGE
jgi:hypothetical protein